jgi:hypothetical protein
MTGAMRILLAFAGHNSSYQNDNASGGNYFLYLANTVHPPRQAVGLFHGKKGANLKEARYVANWEYANEGRACVKYTEWGSYSCAHKYSASSPFTNHAASKSAFTTFDRDVERDIADDGVPVLVAARTASLTKQVGLPSWDINFHDTGVVPASANWRNQCIDPSAHYSKACKTASNYHSLYYDKHAKAINGGHAVTIVGVDDNYYYYLDTCWRRTECRDGEDEGPSNFTSSPYPWTWKIPKASMWQLMDEWKGLGGWLSYSGPASYTTTGR